MTTETKEPQVANSPKSEEVWPRKVGDKTFHSAQELETYLSDLKEQIKAARDVLGGKPTRALSAKKIAIEKVIEFLNTGKLPEEITKMDETYAIRIMWNSDNGKFEVPVKAPTQPRAPGEGVGRGSPLVVDGKSYPSAKAAREQLYPDTAGRDQNRQTIISYLKTKGHVVLEDKADSTPQAAQENKTK